VTSGTNLAFQWGKIAVNLNLNVLLVCRCFVYDWLQQMYGEQSMDM
jgi:hypothetical protein